MQLYANGYLRRAPDYGKRRHAMMTSRESLPWSRYPLSTPIFICYAW